MVETLAHAPPKPGSVAAREPGLFARLYALPRLELSHGRGSWVFDAGGRKYLDFASGIAVSALGHAVGGFSQHVARQMRQLVHCSNYFANRPAIDLAESLTRATGYPLIFFCNSGTEGVEAALKFARFGARLSNSSGSDVLAFTGGFHGRTAFSLSVTWNASYREPFEPLVGGVRFAPFNDCNAIEEIPWTQIGAVIVEPVQGESGAVAATPEFLHALRERTTQVGAALILDEVQCGLGRCGSFLAAQSYGVRADFVVLGKALAGGLPMAAVLMTNEWGDALTPGLHGTTFGGGPVVASAAGFVVERILTPRFMPRVQKRGGQLDRGLTALAQRRSSLLRSQGKGLLRAVVLSPKSEIDADQVVRTARDKGLLLVPSGRDKVRFLPPLTVTAAEVRVALSKFEETMVELETTGGNAR